MVDERAALIIATDAFSDPALTALRAPSHDAAALADVLGDPNIGGFFVESLVNRPCHELNRGVARFFANRHAGDLLLLHISSHGIKDDSGDLYFAATDTTLDLLEATGVSSEFVNKMMDRSRAGRVLLFLDCCYAGAFAKGLATRAGTSVEINERLGGRGRAVITASSALQYSFEGTTLTDSNVQAGQPSVFTSALVKGLRTGEADRDLDGWVSLDELYAYLYDEVRRVAPQQTPKKWAFDVGGDLFIARRGTPVATPAELPTHLRESLDSLLPWQREAAVAPLGQLLASEHAGRSLGARLALEELAENDDSERVRRAARAVLTDGHPETALSPAPTSAPNASGDLGAEIDSSSPTAQIPLRRSWWLVALGLLTVVVGGVALLGNWPGHDGGEKDVRHAPLATTELVVSTGIWGESGQLMVINTVTQAQRVLKDGENFRWPNPSPDRNWIAYVVEDESGATVPHLIRPDGTDDHVLLGSDMTPECPSTGRPAWSPDGTRLVVVCLNADHKTVTAFRVVDVDGSGGRLLLGSADLLSNPTWAADGRILVPSRADDAAPYTLHWITESGGELTALDPEETLNNYQPDWSPQGILFVRVLAQHKVGDAYVQGNVTPETARGDVLVSSWAPDDQPGVFAFMTNDEDDVMHLWVQNPDADATEIGHGQFDTFSWGSR